MDDRSVRTTTLPPSAPVLLESMRAIGYDAGAAVADLVDNSLAAGAGRVHIRFDPGAPRAIAILDDGIGMDENKLREAMKHGSRSPTEERPAGDLGRFGLGLKTASLSQCRRLTVLSRKGGKTSGMVWDLDLVVEAQDWVVQVLDEEDLEIVPYLSYLKELESGTLVVWEKLDILTAGDGGDGVVLSDRMKLVTEHLSLVFHRYLSTRPQKFVIEVNHVPVEPLDPFLEDAGSEAGPVETIPINGEKVVLRAYTLPHISRLNRAQIEKAGGEMGLRRQQGFYVYRDRRLIIWGTWFRLFKQEELTKLTRVRVDVPTSLDHLWCLDIKKSMATPPAAIRERLKGLVPTMVRPSRHAHEYRGRATATGPILPVWKRIEDRDGVRYEVDLDHPVVASLRRSADESLLPELNNVLRAISATLPVEALYNDRANDKMGHSKAAERDPELAAELEELARQMLGAFDDAPEARGRLLAALGTLEPFALHPRLIASLIRRLS